METFYEMAQSIIGELPETSLFIYDITTLFLIIVSICIFVIPISVMFRKVCG